MRNITKSQLVILLAISMSALPGLAQIRPSVLLKNVNVIGMDGTVKEHVDVSMEGNVILDVGPNLTPRRNQTVLDKSGKFVIPGLIDTRVQIGSSPANRINRAELGEEQRIAWMHSMVREGVTTARLIQGDLSEHTGFKHFRTLNLLNSPWIVVSGPSFTALDGIPANQYGIVATSTKIRETSEVKDEDEAIQKSREVAHGGGEIFEIYYTEGLRWSPTPRLKDDLLAIITKEAHGHELRSFCWVGSNAEAKTAIAKGCDVLQGLSEEVADQQLLDLMASKKIAFVPSLAAQGYLLLEKTKPEALFAYLGEDYVARALSPLIKRSFEQGTIQIANVRSTLNQVVPSPPEPKPEKTGAQPDSQNSAGPSTAAAGNSKPESDAPQAAANGVHGKFEVPTPQQQQEPAAPSGPRPTIRQVLTEQEQRAKENVKKMADRGIPLVVGTGAGALLNIPGAAEHLEMRLLVEAGATPLQALQAATSNAAYALGKPQEFGSVEKGKLADVVVLDANPLADIRNTTKIDTVIRGSWIINQQDQTQY